MLEVSTYLRRIGRYNSQIVTLTIPSKSTAQPFVDKWDHNRFIDEKMSMNTMLPMQNYPIFQMSLSVENGHSTIAARTCEQICGASVLPHKKHFASAVWLLVSIQDLGTKKIAWFCASRF